MRAECGTRLACLAACCLLAGALTCAQTASAQASKAAGEEAQKTPRKEKPALADVTRVSTEKAVRSAAKEKSKQSEGKAEEETTPDSGVTEFRPARPGEKDAAEDRSISDRGKKSKGRVLKNVHGTAHGSTNASGTGNRTGGTVGASSPSGRTSIYVEGERNREKLPRN